MASSLTNSKFSKNYNNINHQKRCSYSTNKKITYAPTLKLSKKPTAKTLLKKETILLRINQLSIK